MTKPSPTKPESDTEDPAAAYDRWFRAKVLASLNDPRPGLPHDTVMAELERMIADAEQERNR